MGYDISDYRAIDEKYGSMDDVDRMCQGLHQRENQFPREV